jgi:ABC-type dipeptide/oligopeptide/nickel transport system permease subunit
MTKSMPRTVSSSADALNASGHDRRGRRSPGVWWLLGIGIGLIMVLLVLPSVMRTSPTALHPEALLAPPSLDHPFGTDQIGRDVAARVVHGARLSLLVAACALGIALVLGGALGATAAIGPRWIDEVIMRATDLVLALPGILLIIVLAAVIGPSLVTTLVVLGIMFTPLTTRFVRGLVFGEQSQDYVLAARLFGSTRSRIVGYHIGINTALPLAAYSTVVLADAIIAEAALSFLGAGVKPPAPSWGNLIRDGYTVVHTGAWWVALFPGLAVVVVVFSLIQLSNAMGQGLRTR